jgi:RNA polymerase sigma factor (sigma-70 family)
MASIQASPLIRHLRRAVLLRDGAGLTDGQLIECFLNDREEAALEALVRRHSPMVWGVCRRILRDHHEAEDAFQATFLVLVRKASSIMPREKVANWLYGVANQTARKARATAARRQGRERQVTVMPDVQAAEQELWHSVEPLLDQELSRLPNKYRAVLVLCDLEGRTRREAARQLGVPEGTVAGHLARARALLAQRLTRRGTAVSGALLTTLVTQNAASASVPNSLLFSTVKAVTLLATGQAAVGVVPAQVAALVKGVMHAMLLKKLKLGVLALLLALATIGGGGMTYRSLASGVQSSFEGRPRQVARPQPSQNSTLEEPVKYQAATAPLGAGPPRFQVEHTSPVLCLAWPPDGKQVFAGTDGYISVIDPATGKHVHRGFPTETAMADMAIAPDGKALAILMSGNRQRNGATAAVMVWNIATGKLEGQAGGAFAATPAERLAFTPDSQMTMGVGVGSLYRWKNGGSNALGSYLGAGFTAIAPDGSVAGWCEPNGKCAFYVYEPNNPKIGVNRLQVGAAQSIAFGPGAKLLAIGGDDKEIHLWDLAEKKPTAELTGLENPATKLAFSADGKTLAAVASNGTSIRVWDLNRNSTRCQINHNLGEVGLLALSPDGKTLATTARDGKVLFLWTTSARDLSRKGRPLELSAKELAALWTDLAHPDYEKADKAWLKLGAAGDNALPTLREKILAVAVPPVDMKKIEKLVADLDSEKFATRDQAINALMATGELAIVPLQRVLDKPPSAEARERAKLLLKKIGEPNLTPERQRVLDAIDLLEREGTTAAIGLLAEIERDGLIPLIRTEARLALERLGQLKEKKE